MLSARDNYTALLSGEKPERLVNQYEPFAFFMGDPLMGLSRGARVRGRDTVDRWGVTIRWKEHDHAGMPYITDATRVCKDIEDWRRYVKAPSLAAPLADWDAARSAAAKFDRKEKLLTCFMATGLFEQAHFLMGFEDTLVNLLAEPEASHELLDYLLDYKLEYAQLLIDNLHPDAILSHDDWGSKTRLFMSRETWREFFYPRYKKLYGYIASRGVQVVHHADSYCMEIADLMPELDIAVWQGVLPTNDIPALQRSLGGRMALMGGIAAERCDVSGWTEEQVRREVRRAVGEYEPGGGFIPCITYGLPESIFPGVYEAISGEIAAINRERK